MGAVVVGKQRGVYSLAAALVGLPQQIVGTALQIDVRLVLAVLVVVQGRIIEILVLQVVGSYGSRFEKHRPVLALVQHIIRSTVILLLTIQAQITTFHFKMLPCDYFRLFCQQI